MWSALLLIGTYISLFYSLVSNVGVHVCAGKYSYPSVRIQVLDACWLVIQYLIQLIMFGWGESLHRLNLTQLLTRSILSSDFSCIWLRGTFHLISAFNTSLKVPSPFFRIVYILYAKRDVSKEPCRALLFFKMLSSIASFAKYRISSFVYRSELRCCTLYGVWWRGLRLGWATGIVLW